MPAEDFEVIADHANASREEVWTRAYCQLCQALIGRQRGGGGYQAALGGRDSVGSDELATRVGEQGNMDDHVVEIRAVNRLEAFGQDGEWFPAHNDQLGLLQHLAARGLERVLAKLNSTARERPAAERWGRATFDPNDAVGAANHGQSDL